jgi:hypothetical protein
MGLWWITELVSWYWGLYSKLNYPTLLGEELTRQSRSCRATQLPPGENNNRPDHFAQNGKGVTSGPNCNLPYGQMEPNTAHKAKSLGETTSGLLLAMNGP